MEEQDDDFGDLYADVEVPASSAIIAIPSLNQLCIGHEEKERNGLREGPCPNLRLNKVNSVSVELSLHREDDQNNQERNKSADDGSENSASRSGADNDKELMSEYGSDSEDDLHIVLNEDCRMFPTPRRANVGSGEAMECSDDDFVIGTEANGNNKDRKWVDQLQLPSDGPEQGSTGHGTESGNGIKGSYLSKHSQYKYIRRHTSTIPSNTQANGSGRSSWDLNECNQLVGSSSRAVASSCSTIVPLVAHNGFDFSLPRYRTILDVNIETFEQKPWRHPGVDITDFFNFGLGEESWKQYCNCVEQFRQQATMLTKNPINKSLMPNQPKGRAIQVEGGIGERQPSMDVRRTRNRDSDVVIQISVQDSMEDSSGSGTEKTGRIDDFILEASDNGVSDMDDNREMHHLGGACGEMRTLGLMDKKKKRFDGPCPPSRCSPPRGESTVLFPDPNNQGKGQITDVDGCFHNHADKHFSCESTGAMKAIKHKKVSVDKKSLRTNPIGDAESSPANQTQHSSSPSYIDSHSEASKVGVDSDSEKFKKPAKRPTSNSNNELLESITSDFYHLGNCNSNDSKIEPMDCRDDSRNRSSFQEERHHRSRMRFRSGAEMKSHIDDVAAPISDRKAWYDGNHLSLRHGRRKERPHDYGFYDGEDLSYYRETEISIGYHCKRSTYKHGKNTCSETFHRKDQARFRDEMNLYHKRNWDGRKYFIEQRDDVESNKMKKSDRYLRERGHTDVRMNELTFEEPTRSIPEHSFNKDKEKYLRQRSKGDGEHYESWSRRRTEGDDFVLEHRFREESVQERYGRPVPYHGRREPFEEKYRRHIPYLERETKSCGGRERLVHSPSFDVDSSWRSEIQDDECWGEPNLRSLSPYKKSHIAMAEDWLDTSSPRDDMYDLGRWDKRYVDQRKKSHYYKYRHRGWFYTNCKDDYIYGAEDGAIYPNDEVCDKGRRFNRQSETLHWAEDKLSSRHQDRDDLYAKVASFNGRGSKEEHMYSKHESSHCGVLLDENQVDWDRNSNHQSPSFDVYRSKHEQAALRSRDSVDMHLVGWEGKPYGRWPKAGDVISDGRHDTKEHRVFRCNGESRTGKANSPHISKTDRSHTHNISSKIERAGESELKLSPDRSNEKWLDKYPVTQHEEVLGLEEGQLPVEEAEKIEVGHTDKKGVPDNKMPAEDENKVGGVDNTRILASLAKMEKRRERFKEPITIKESVKNPEPQPEPVSEVTDVKQQRPARKRRWGGS